MNPIITPILPILLNIPESIPAIAKAAITIGGSFPIIPSTTPIVTPPTVPSSTPLFHPNISTIKIHKIFLREYPNIVIGPNADIAIEIKTAAPIISSIENTVLYP